MYYGNFSRFKFIFAIKEIPELVEYLNLSAKIKSMQIEEAHRLLEEGKGMAAVDALLKEAEVLEIRKKEIYDTVTSDKKNILTKYNITIEELSKI